jgi:outer membrane receptor protein involved in Fe transport
MPKTNRMKLSYKLSLRHLAGVSAIALAMGTAPAFAQTATSQSSSSASSSAAPAQTPAPAPKPATQPAQPAAQTQTAAPGAGSGAANPPADAGPGDSTTITITGAAPKEVTHKADRDVYDTKQDPTSATGSAADVLNNVPAVTVDSDGTVALRGNTNVQVYINGKKSTQTSGDNRAFTLQSLAGDDIDNVEVITNPSAAFGADTTGGIININLKRGRSIKPQTGFNITAGDRGRGSVGFNTGVTIDKLTLSGSLRYNAGAAGGFGQGRGGGGGGGGGGSKSKQFTDRISLDPTTGAVTREDVTKSVSKGHSNGGNLNLNGNYNLSDSDTLEGNFGYNRNHLTSFSGSETQSYNGLHALTQDYGQLRNTLRNSENMNFGLNFDHRGEIGTTEDFKMAYQHGQSLTDNFVDTQNIYHFSTTPVPGTNTYSAQHRKSKQFSDDFSGDWSHPVKSTDEEQSQIQVGWDILNEINEQYSYQSQTVTSPVTPPTLPRNNQVTQFNTNDLYGAAYITWQQQWSKFGYNVGLRVETLNREIESQNLVPSAHPGTPDPVNKSEYDQVSYTPSMFLLYNATEKDRFKFIYSQKIQRPSAQQLNPVIQYSDDLLTANSGNANLKNAKSNNYELDYYRDVGGNNLSTSIYYNETEDSINPVQTYIASPVAGGTPVLLTSYENSGTSRRTGISLNYGGTLFTKLRYRIGGDLSDVVTASFDPATHALLHTVRPNSSVMSRLTYTIDPKNTISANLNFRGQSGDLQSYTTPSTSMMLSYIYQVIPSKAIITVNASNFLVGPLSKRVYASSITQGYSQTLNPGATFMVSFRYTFGAVRQQQRGQGGFQRPDGGFGGGQGGQGGQGGGGFGGGRGGGGGFGGGGGGGFGPGGGF